jgi:non-ribosomal peptide synthetase component F
MDTHGNPLSSAPAQSLNEHTLITFIQLVERVRGTGIGAMERDELPFSNVVQKLQLQPRRDPARHPQFQIMFSFEPPLPKLEPGWEFTLMDVETGMTKFDLHLEMDERSDGLLARFIYNVGLFERHTMGRMAKEWLRIATQADAEPDARLSQLVVRSARKFRERIWSLLPTSHSFSWRRPDLCETFVGGRCDRNRN